MKLESIVTSYISLGSYKRNPPYALRIDMVIQPEEGEKISELINQIEKHIKLLKSDENKPT